MQFRPGKCGSCQATFKVPASFGGDKAKCKSCGTGVVAIGPIEEEEGELAEHKPSGKREGGPSMMERLRAERSAAEQAKPLPAKKPSAQKATDKGASGPSTASPRNPGDRQAPVSSTGGGRPGRTASRRARVTRGRGRRSGTEDGDAKARGKRGRPQKKKIRVEERREPMGTGQAFLIFHVGGAVLITLLAGAYNALSQWGSEDTGTPATPAGLADASPEQSPQDQTPDSEVDPNGIDLTGFDPLGKDPDCSDEQWAEIVDLALTMADQDSPRQANQAVAELALIGRFAYPAMVNEFLKLDLTDYEGHRQGDYYQRAMENLLGGRNYGWKYDFDTEPNKTALYNKKVVLNYYNTGGKVSGKPNAWNDLSKNEDNTNRPAPETEVESGLSEDDLDNLDF